MPNNKTMAQPSVRHRLAIVYADLGISRRNLVGFLNDQFWNFDGKVYDSSGSYVELLLIDADDVFRTDFDPSERWTSSFYKSVDDLPRQATQEKVLPRIYLLWLALAIRCPSLAAHVIS
jgi:hypothetical protein